MTEKVRHVEARFNGQMWRFELREKLVGGFSRLEAQLGGRKPYPLFQTFATGAWSVADLEAVLSAALPFADSDTSALDAFLSRAAPAPYAILAVKILEAYLFGLPPADAVFDGRGAGA